MKLFAVLITLLLVSPLLQASEQSLVSRSAGKLVNDSSLNLSEKLLQEDLLIRSPASAAEDSASKPLETGKRAYAAHPSQYFEIYDAEVYQTSDLDGDGYSHRLGVIFDVDVFYGDADIYAKIYLSREAGPWTQVFTTDLFFIVEDSAADTYEVTTELIDGYAPGYYSVLVEVYSLQYPHMVASASLDFDNHGSALRLEDQYWDDPYAYAYSETYTEVSYSHGGGGSLGILPMLLGVLVIAARGRKKSLSPPSKTMKRNPCAAILSNGLPKIQR